MLLFSQNNPIGNLEESSKKIVEFLRLLRSNSVSVQDLLEFDDIDENRALQIIAALEIGKRYYKMVRNDDLRSNWDFENLKQTERQHGVHFFSSLHSKIYSTNPRKNH